MSGGEIERPRRCCKDEAGWGNRIDGLPASWECRFRPALRSEF